MRFISIGEGSKELLFYGCFIGGDARCKTNQRRRSDGLVSTNVDGVHDAAPLGLYEYSAAQEVAEALGLSVAADPRAAP